MANQILSKIPKWRLFYTFRGFVEKRQLISWEVFEYSFKKKEVPKFAIGFHETSN